MVYVIGMISLVFSFSQMSEFYSNISLHTISLKTNKGSSEPKIRHFNP